MKVVAPKTDTHLYEGGDCTPFIIDIGAVGQAVASNSLSPRWNGIIADLDIDGEIDGCVVYFPGVAASDLVESPEEYLAELSESESQPS